MAEQRFNPENLIELAEDLRLAGFDIGTQQYIAAQDLLIALAAHNRLPADPHDWRSLLAPIFCASPAEQEEFYGRFDLWLKRQPEWKAIEDDLAEPGSREIVLPAASILWLRKPVGVTTTALLILLTGFAVFLSLKTNRTLTGQVFSSDGDSPVAKAQVEFFNQSAETDNDGKFTIKYQSRNWSRVFNRQVAELRVTHSEHEPFAGTKLDVHQPSNQTIKLQKRAVLPDDPKMTSETFPKETLPPVIPLLRGLNVTDRPNAIRWYRWLLAVAPLILFAAWLILRWRRRRALLQKLQVAGSPNLRRLTVRGASEQLFQSQMFRRAVQNLRCHRRVENKELDIISTVRATINRGGIFQPLYGSRKALPEYLMLIDRASPADEQARFADELSHRLEAGGVFVDRFYFQNDPLTCRSREANSATVTLLDLAARFPEHQLLIFSDGAGFISPVTGEAEHWVTIFSHWPRRVLLTPELHEQNGYRELALIENDFLVLPANDDGFRVLTEAINTAEVPNLKQRQGGKGSANPFPQLILERPKRWLERHEPRPAVLNELCGQLRAYLGEDGWYWLAACAVYPALSWDVTLYLGYKLFGKNVGSPAVSEGLGFEERLLRLVRLPWFRYGSMPDWLRLRLIESFTPEQQIAVRQTIETMLLGALEHPHEGIPLDIAELQPVPDNWLRRWKTKWNEWRRKKRITEFIKKEIEKGDDASPLNDFVFLGFLSGGRTRRLMVKLPELLNRMLFPQGHAILGLRSAARWGAIVLILVLTAKGYWLIRENASIDLFAIMPLWEDASANSIAILPLVNQTNDTNLEYITDGITETLIHNISQLPGLKVTSRTSVFRYKNQPSIDPAELGDKFDVRAILTGRVIKLDQTLVITVELVRTRDGSRLWGGEYRYLISDLLAAQSVISQQVSGQLRSQLSGAEREQIAKGFTENPEAYRLYLNGRFEWNRQTIDSFRKAIEHYKQAIAADNNYALAYAGLADVYGTLAANGLASSDYARLSKENAERAVMLDDQLPEAHHSLGTARYFDWDLPGAGRELLRAISLNANLAESLSRLNVVLQGLDRFDEAIAVGQQALALDPYSLRVHLDLQFAYFYAGRYDQCVEVCRKMLLIESRYFPAYLDLGRAYEQKKMYTEAIAELTKARELSNDEPLTLAALGHVYAVSGRTNEAQSMLDLLLQAAQKGNVRPYEIAKVYAGLGNADRAFEWLGKAFRDHNSWLLKLKSDPNFVKLHPDFRFQALLKQIRPSQ